MNLHSTMQRVLQRTDVSGRGCWVWTGSKTTAGYGQISVENWPNYVHRLSYEYFVDDIPEHKAVKHLCENRACIRPEHLEVGDKRGKE